MKSRSSARPLDGSMSTHDAVPPDWQPRKHCFSLAMVPSALQVRRVSFGSPSMQTTADGVHSLHDARALLQPRVPQSTSSNLLASSSQLMTRVPSALQTSGSASHSIERHSFRIPTEPFSSQTPSLQGVWLSQYKGFAREQPVAQMLRTAPIIGNRVTRRRIAFNRKSTPRLTQDASAAARARAIHLTRSSS